MNHRENIWPYLEGTLSRPDRVAFEAALQRDAALRRHLAEARQLDKALIRQDIDQPSMRFTARVMAQLPPRYRKINPEPLLSRRRVRQISFLILGFLVINLLIALNVPADSLTQWPFLQSWQEALRTLPGQSSLLLNALSLAYLFFVVLDSILARRMLPPQNQPDQVSG